MCSTPKSQSQIGSAKKYQSTSILAKLTTEQRQRFVQKANKAAERRYQLQQTQLVANALKTKKSAPSEQGHSWYYWLINASISALFLRLKRSC